MKAPAPHCPVHVGTRMKRYEVHDTVRNRPQARARCIKRFFRCPITQCTRVESDKTFYTSVAWAGEFLDD